MKTHFIVIGIVSFGFLQSCTRKVPASTQAGYNEIKVYNEDLRDVLPAYDVIVPAQKQNNIEDLSPQTITTTVAEEPKHDNISISKVLEIQKAKNQKISQVQGYRLSIYSGNNRSGFEAAKAYILQNFPELEVYESYSQPTYKVKVGDFISRMDAEAYHAALKGRFAAPKIMMDLINYKNGLQISKQ